MLSNSLLSLYSSVKILPVSSVVFFSHKGGLYSCSSIHCYIPFAALLGHPGLGHIGLTKRSKYCNRKVIHSQKFSIKSLSSSYKRLHFSMIKNHILKQHILKRMILTVLGLHGFGKILSLLPHSYVLELFYCSNKYLTISQEHNMCLAMPN